MFKLTKYRAGLGWILLGVVDFCNILNAMEQLGLTIDDSQHKHWEIPITEDAAICKDVQHNNSWCLKKIQLLDNAEGTRCFLIDKYHKVI